MPERGNGEGLGGILCIHQFETKTWYLRFLLLRFWAVSPLFLWNSPQCQAQSS